MRTLLITLFVVATVGVCHGVFDLTPEGEKLYAKLFEMGQEPMSTQETINALYELKGMSKNEFIQEHSNRFLKAANFEVEKCTSVFFEELEHIYKNHKYGGRTEGDSITNAARMVNAQIEPFQQFCINAYNQKLDEGTRSAQQENVKAMDELLQAVDKKSFHPVISRNDIGYLWEDIAKFVEKKAGEGALYSKSWALSEPKPDQKKYEAAYRKYVVEPCNKFRSTLGPAGKIGAAFSARLSEDMRKKAAPLAKKWQICEFVSQNNNFIDDFERVQRKKNRDYY